MAIVSMAQRTHMVLLCFGLGSNLACSTRPPAPSDSLHTKSVHSAQARACYRGTQTLAGHYAQPGATQRFGLTVELQVGPDSTQDQQGKVVLSSWSAETPDAVEREELWVQTDRVIHVSQDGQAAQASAWEASWAHKLLHMAGGTVGSTQQIQKASHPTFGDVVERVQLGETTLLDHLSAPGSLSLEHATDSTLWTAEVEREPCPAATAAQRPTLSPTAAQAVQPITWSQLADGVALASLHGSDISSLVVELSDSLIVCECGLTVQQGEQFVDALTRRFPHKPIAHVLFSHHHPHYTGGLRAFMAAGAVIHAPVHNAQFVEQLATRPFKIAPDRLARNKTPVRIEPFEGAVTLYDAGHAVLEAIDIGSESSHTEEYVLTYLPRHKLLFQGDLGWSARPGEKIRAGRRAKGLLQAISSRGLAVDNLVQSWPLMGASQVIGFAALQAAVVERDAAQESGR